jgi:hypothetical protein
MRCAGGAEGIEPLTPCMPSRDPHHGTHHKTLRSKALHQSSTAREWWFVWVHRAELLRGCCAKRMALAPTRQTVGTTFG